MCGVTQNYREAINGTQTGNWQMGWQGQWTRIMSTYNTWEIFVSYVHFFSEKNTNKYKICRAIILILETYVSQQWVTASVLRWWTV